MISCLVVIFYFFFPKTPGEAAKQIFLSGQENTITKKTLPSPFAANMLQIVYEKLRARAKKKNKIGVEELVKHGYTMKQIEKAVRKGHAKGVKPIGSNWCRHYMDQVVSSPSKTSFETLSKNERSKKGHSKKAKRKKHSEMGSHDDREPSPSSSRPCNKELNPSKYHYLSDLNEIVFDGIEKENWITITGDMREKQVRIWKCYAESIYHCYFDWCYNIQMERLQLDRLEINIKHTHIERHSQRTHHQHLSSDITNPIFQQIIDITTRAKTQSISNPRMHNSSLLSAPTPRGVKVPIAKWELDKGVLLKIGTLVSIENLFDCEITRDGFILVLKYLALIQNGITKVKNCKIDLRHACFVYLYLFLESKKKKKKKLFISL
ncbi:hypothetical protein RFI_25778 [Reticulomyxa filosa]|uniref:Uncharacterized protein n=1 Tax=Reticulomyxa filosa TaxID=46433 RepID=X6MCJ6_RETFI|nr:hypothetical protein RFI_25778 [Reticulomyxa filosa]|eukprot:ETO11599.1 hypothetical protein RFI_25778 [Reticulomyxa filosa]